MSSNNNENDKITIFIQDQSSGDKAHPKTASKKMYNSPLTDSASCQVGANEDTGVVKHNEKLDLESKCWKAGIHIHFFLDKKHFYN